MEKVICFIDYTGALDFFTRLANSDKEKEYVFITPILSARITTRTASNIRVIYCSKWSKVYPSDELDPNSIDVLRFKELQLGLMNISEAQHYFLNLYSLAKSEILNSEKTYIVNWNGESASGCAARCLKDRYRHVSLLFCEISNLPSKMFVDCEGVNASSSLYSNPNKLFDSKYKFSELEAEKWKNRYINLKLSSNNKPQQSSLMKKRSFRLVIDILSVCFTYRFFTTRSVLNRIPSILSKKTTDKSVKFEYEWPSDAPFVFVPLQVSSDTQLLLNSDIGNLDLIEKVLLKTKHNLYIKPHPAESDLSYLVRWYEKQTNEIRKRVFFTSIDTYALISQCDAVHVINSTVGFESMIFGKDVTFYGRTIYTNFNKSHINPYIMSFLVDIDFFDSETISEKEVSLFFERGEI